MKYLSKFEMAVILLLTPVFSYGQFVSVCDRTPQVRDAIMEKAAVIDSEIECQDDDLLELILPVIEFLDLTGKNITSLKLGDFSGLTSLHSLALTENNLTALPPGIFAGLVLLVFLNLDDNNLTALPPDIFSGLSSLMVLYLDDNELTALPPGIFTGTFLRELTLQRNKLSTLPPGIFEGQAYLIAANLAGNPLSEQTKQSLESSYSGIDFHL